MGLIKGGFQRLLQTILYFVLFCLSGIILGFFSYFLSVLANRNVHIPTWEKAVEGISGAACLYLIFAVVLTCCLGGITGLAIMAIILDLCFAAGMVAIIVLTRHGADKCKGHVNTPLGSGQASQDNGFGNSGFGGDQGENITYSVHLGLACKFEKVCFACAIIAAILFLITAALQVMLMRHHKKEKRYGPGPSNNYTSGSKKSRFSRKKNTEKSAEAGTLNNTTDNRVSHETGYTGTTVGNGGYDNYDKTATTGGQNGYYTPPTGTQGATHAPTGGHSGYYTAPTGTQASPYGYNNTVGANQYGHSNAATNY